MFEKITNRFQFKFKGRFIAANILGESVKDKIKKQEEQKSAVVLGIKQKVEIYNLLDLACSLCQNV